MSGKSSTGADLPGKLTAALTRSFRVFPHPVLPEGAFFAFAVPDQRRTVTHAPEAEFPNRLHGHPPRPHPVSVERAREWAFCATLAIAHVSERLPALQAIQPHSLSRRHATSSILIPHILQWRSQHGRQNPHSCGLPPAPGFPPARIHSRRYRFCLITWSPPYSPVSRT